MTRISKLVGFPADAMHSFRLSKKYRLRESGVAALRLLEKIYDGIPKAPHRHWLCRFRPAIREIRRLNETAVLTQVVNRTSIREVRILAIWLRGRCGGHLGTDSIAQYATSADATVRKEVVRALVRMNAWGKLAEIAKRERDPRIRQLATSRSSADFRVRLDRFAVHVTPAEVTGPTQSFYVSPNVEFGKWHPAKSIEYIRQILQRIRNLVHRYQHQNQAGTPK
jgi:hypothetical protein